MSNTMVNAVKSLKIRVGSSVVAVVVIVISVVLYKSGAVLRPNTIGFIKKWLSPPYIYLVLNLVIILIVASPRLLHSVLWIFNYFKQVENRHNEAIGIRDDDASGPSSPPSSAVETTTTTFSDRHFYKDWQDLIPDQSPTSLSALLEIEPFDEPWPDIIDTDIKSFNGREGASPPLSLLSDEIIKSKPKFDENTSLKSMRNANNGREKLVSSIGLVGNNINADDALEGTWKTIMRVNDTISSPSLIRSKGGGERIIEEKKDTFPPLQLTDTYENSYTGGVNEDETIDSTWKAIMEGKETSSPSLSLNTTELEKINIPSGLNFPGIPRQDALAAWRELRKSETFNETVSARQRAGLRRDPSLSLDDLNCRVESFIKNFNRQMLLQRQESEQRFSEMINSGGY